MLSNRESRKAKYVASVIELLNLADKPLTQQKRAITKMIKVETDYLSHYKASIKEGEIYGMYLGERTAIGTAARFERELGYLKEFRESLNEIKETKTEGVSVILSAGKSIEYFHNALCNGLDYVLGHGLEIDYDSEQYKKAKSSLSNPCYEDVLIQILKEGGVLAFHDVEGGDGERFFINLNDVCKKVQLTPIRHLSDMINENDDAETADVILQTVFLGKIIYG